MTFELKKIGENNRSIKLEKKSCSSSCILLTATIAPPEAAVARNDPQVRLRDYLASLEFYLSLPKKFVDRILFVDNSGSDIKPIEDFVRAKAADKVVELMSFRGNNHPVSYGKAYGEFKLMDFGLEHTSLLSDSDYFWKITGRLKVLNLSDLMIPDVTDYDVLCDLHNLPFVGTGKIFANRWMDLRLFSCSVKAYKKLFAGKYAQFGPRMNQGALYEVVMGGRRRMKILPRFPTQPVVSGFSGRHDREYHHGIQRMKTGVRALIRNVVPSIWI